MITIVLLISLLLPSLQPYRKLHKKAIRSEILIIVLRKIVFFQIAWLL